MGHPSDYQYATRGISETANNRNSPYGGNDFIDCTNSQALFPGGSIILPIVEIFSEARSVVIADRKLCLGAQERGIELDCESGIASRRRVQICG